MHIELFTHQNVDKLTWPDNKHMAFARSYLLPMVKEGVKAYISNVETQLCLLKVNSNILPITINEQEYDNSYLTSNYFCIKYLEERIGQRTSYLSYAYRKLIASLGLLLKSIKINKVVIVNNWLLTTNIYPNLNASDISAVTKFLTQRFPDHMLIFRSLNACKHEALTQLLTQQRYRLLFARNVCIYDPEKKGSFSSKVFYHHRRDRRLIQDKSYEVVRCEQLNAEEIQRLLQLYSELYIKKHTRYSPHFTEKFLRENLEKKLLSFIALKKNGQIHGVIGFFERESTLIAPFCGYEHTSEEGGHLYRMLTILAIEEAEKRNVLLNDGSGGEAPKQYRGMQIFPEYIALYDCHLSFYRRIAWSLAEFFVKKVPKKFFS